MMDFLCVTVDGLRVNACVHFCAWDNVCERMDR